MSTTLHTSSLLSRKLTELLDELCEECEQTIRLVSQLNQEQHTLEQLEDILAELTASVSHLHIHTKGMDDLITEELIGLPDVEE